MFGLMFPYLAAWASSSALSAWIADNQYIKPPHNAKIKKVIKYPANLLQTFDPVVICKFSQKTSVGSGGSSTINGTFL